METKTKNSVVAAGGSADSDGDTDVSIHSAMHSAATTQPSSPRPVGEMFAPVTASSMPWEKIRQRLVQMALDGDEDVDYYGDIISDRGAIERFLSAAKGNIDKAADQMRAHLQWRRKFNVDELPEEDFSDMKAWGELYWGGTDNQGVQTMTWILRKHDSSKVSAERFVRFLVYQIETGMRSSPQYPNTPFNIIVDLGEVGFGNNDPEMVGLLQTTLVQNYPKVRKALYVFPVNWFVSLFWDTIIKPILMTLQPDIEDKILPLTGDYEAKLKERFDVDQIETAYGGTLNVASRGEPVVLPYQPVSVKSMLLRQGHRPAAAAHSPANPSPEMTRAVPPGAAAEAEAGSSPSSATLVAAQKLVREEQRVRRKEARTRHHTEIHGEEEGKAAKRGRGSGIALKVWALCAFLWAGYVCTSAEKDSGVGAWGSAAVASGVAVAVSAMVGGRVDKVEVLEEKQAVLRMKRERGHAEGRHWISKYAQVCGF